jgi:hypothetical protein
MEEKMHRWAEEDFTGGEKDKAASMRAFSLSWRGKECPRMAWYCPSGVAQRRRGDSGSQAIGGDAGGEERAAAERERSGAE